MARFLVKRGPMRPTSAVHITRRDATLKNFPAVVGNRRTQRIPFFTQGKSSIILVAVEQARRRGSSFSSVYSLKGTAGQLAA